MLSYGKSYILNKASGHICHFDLTDSQRPKFQFLKGPDEAMAAIHAILSADPRSVYRRAHCQDRLFFFTLDTADITCWFGDGFAEVVRVKAVQG